MWTGQSAALFWALLAVFPLMVSFIYFAAAPDEASTAQKFGTSAHGVFIALLQLATVYIAAAGLHGAVLGGPFAVSLIMAVALIVYSSGAYRGSVHLHWLQAINIVWLLGLWFLGGMAITGRWL